MRQLIIATAEALPDVTELEETLKWNEPSYLTKHGSTVRIDWKPKTPDRYAIYFKCTSKLVKTFRQVYPQTFTYEGHRAIVFGMDEQVPEEELRRCIAAALTYHRMKETARLGLS